jgi:predicted aldo/keto reductase-like oxidoreductase
MQGMIYRNFGNTDIKPSQLGFGLMRLPLRIEFKPEMIDRRKARRMLHYAIEHGVNYLDTAYPYHSGTSEEFLGKALTKGYRGKVYVATKLPTWFVKKKSDPQKFFNEQLKRLKTDCIDMYALHGLGKNTWETVKKFDLLSFMDKMHKKGKIHFPGFSFHDTLPLFKEIVDAYPWTFCMIHLNYVDEHYQAGVKGLEYAYSKGLAVIVMEPLRGGKLSHNVPKEILDIIKKSGRKQTPAEFALRWVLNKPEVSLLLSGMSTTDHVKENVAFACNEHAGSLTRKELKLYKKAKEFYRSRMKVNCTLCDYCMPCSQKIPISFIFNMFNDIYIYNALKQSQWMYKVFIKPENHADQCIECGKCEERCPQKIPIPEALKKAHKILN